MAYILTLIRRGRNNIYPFAKYSFLDGQPGAWYTNGPLHGVVHGCRGTCTAKLTAPALAAVACSTRILPVNYSEPSGQGPLQAEPLFDNAYDVVPSLDIQVSHEVINLITAYATINDSTHCTGTLNMSICSLVSAVGEYDIVSLCSLLRFRRCLTILVETRVPYANTVIVDYRRCVYPHIP